MRYIIGLLYAIYECAWRRWKGTSGNGKWYYNNVLKMILNIVITFGLLFYIKGGWIIPLIATLVYQFLYWTRNHGAFFDFGHGNPDDKRYNKWWWIKWVKKIVPEKEWYSYWFDFICMCLRYGLPGILIAIILGSPVVCFMGFVHALVYAFCWKLKDWKVIEKPTSTAEWIVGFTCGLFMAFC